MMFLSSYSPLLALLAYTNRDVCGVWPVLAGLSVVSLLGLTGAMAVHRRAQGPRLTVAHAKPQDGDVLAYIATYLIPFLAVDLGTTDGIVVLSGFLLVLMIIYINSSMLFVNPILSLAGYHSFEIEDPDGHVYALLTQRSDLELGSVIRPAQITRYLRVEVRHDR